MKKLLLFLLLSAASLPAFTQTSALEYHDLIMIERAKVSQYISTFNKADTDEVAETARKALISQSDASTAVVEKLGAWKDDAALQKAAQQLFVMTKELATVDYVKMDEMMKSPPDLMTFEVFLADMGDKEKAAFDAFANEEDAFATRWGFKLPEPPEGE